MSGFNGSSYVSPVLPDTNFVTRFNRFPPLQPGLTRSLSVNDSSPRHRRTRPVNGSRPLSLDEPVWDARQSRAFQTYGDAALCLAPLINCIPLPKQSPQAATQARSKRWSAEPVYHVPSKRDPSSDTATRDSFSYGSSLPTPPDSPVIAKPSSLSRGPTFPVFYPTQGIPEHVFPSPIRPSLNYRPNTPLPEDETVADSDSEIERRLQRPVRHGKRAAGALRRSDLQVRFDDHVDYWTYDLEDSEREDKIETFVAIERRATEHEQRTASRSASSYRSRYR